MNASVNNHRGRYSSVKGIRWCERRKTYIYQCGADTYIEDDLLLFNERFKPKIGFMPIQIGYDSAQLRQLDLNFAAHLIGSYKPVLVNVHAFEMDDEQTIYAAHNGKEAIELYFDVCREYPSSEYPRALTDSELDKETPEYDENEKQTGKMTSLRAMLNDCRQVGFLAGSF